MPNTSGNRDLAKEFWDFAVAAYGRPGVQAQLLKWQDQNRTNVNLALLCVWAGLRGRVLNRMELTTAEAAIAGWHSAVTNPLRLLRQRLKGDWRPLAPDTNSARQAVLAAELEAERTEQRLLLDGLAPWPATLPDRFTAMARANLETYLGEAATAAPASIIAAICSSE